MIISQSDIIVLYLTNTHFACSIANLEVVILWQKIVNSGASDEHELMNVFERYLHLFIQKTIMGSTLTYAFVA